MRKRKTRKPKEGVCGICGRAVVIIAAQKPGWNPGDDVHGWEGITKNFGHYREVIQPHPRHKPSRKKIISATERILMGKSPLDLRLVKVRCFICVGK